MFTFLFKFIRIFMIFSVAVGFLMITLSDPNHINHFFGIFNYIAQYDLNPQVTLQITTNPETKKLFCQCIEFLRKQPLLKQNYSDNLQSIQQSQYIFQMQKSFSQISLNSNIEKPFSQKSKHISATNHDSKLSRPDSLQSFESNICIQGRNTQPTKAVVQRIQQIETAQKQLSDKYTKVINNLLLQIRKKDQANLLLQDEITQLTLEIQQSKKDFSIIVNYLKKQERKDTSNVVSKGNLNSTKASDKLDKSVSGSKKKLELSYKFGCSQLKNKSSRQLFPKQTLKC